MRGLIASVLAAACLAGCGGLMREARPVVWLALEPEPPRGGLRAGGPTLEVAGFATVPPFDTDRLPAREGASRWAFSTYHRWVAEPGEMVSSHARDFFGRADLFGAVFTPPAPREADWRISGAVRSLYWDRQRRSAVLEVEVSIVAAPERLAGFRVYRVEVPAAGTDVEHYLKAASTALARVLADVEEDVRRTLASPP
jgi:ABC-type uncharacterized transport system auxiliary subunit